MFFGVLHTWFNMWSEITRFGDRRFYEDWWNCKDFADYYRKWNIVVHEFLYYYIYQDIIRFSKGNVSRNIAKFMVFIISAMIHEVVISCTMGFVFPILFLMFGGPGVILTKFSFGKKEHVGAIFWFLMLIGSGLLFVLVSREWFARQRPDASTYERDGLWMYLYPQSIRFLPEVTINS